MTVAAFVVSLLALFVSGWAAWRANKNAKRSADAATRSAAASERSAAAAESQAALAKKAASKYEVPWSMTQTAGLIWRLTNGSRTDAAYDVSVALQPGSDGQLIDGPAGQTIAPGAEAMVRVFSTSWQMGSCVVEVRWRRSPDGEFEDPWRWAIK